MKKFLSKVGCLVMALTMAVSLSVSAFASELPESKEFTPNSDSTWGDLYRYFEPEEFERLPESVQQQYDTMLLDDETSNAPSAIAETENQISAMENVVSTTGYLYSEDSENKMRAVDIAGLLNLVLGVSSTKTTIDYTVGLFSTVSCPTMYVSASLFDKATGKYLKLDSTMGADSKACNLEGTFSGLTSKHEYTVKASGIVTPPAGYISSGNLAQQIDKKTK